MSTRTVSVTDGGGGTRTVYIPDRARFAGVRTVTVNGQTVTINRSAPVITSDRTGDSRPLLRKIVGGAKAAYSFRDLKDKTGKATVARVRRETDDQERDFLAKDIATCGEWADGKLETTLPLDLINQNTNITEFTFTILGGNYPASFVNEVTGTYTKGPPESISGTNANRNGMSLTDVWTNEHGSKFFGTDPFGFTTWAVISASGSIAIFWVDFNTVNPWNATNGSDFSGQYFQGTGSATQNVSYEPNLAGSAYSLHRLRSSYNSPVLQIRRGSDNVEADVLFDRHGKISNSSPITEVLSETEGTTKSFYVSKATGVSRPLNGGRYTRMSGTSWVSLSSPQRFILALPQGQPAFWMALDLYSTTYAQSAPCDPSVKPFEADWSNTVLSEVDWLFTLEPEQTLGDFINADANHVAFTYSNTSIDSFDGTYNRVSTNSYVNEKGTTITIMGPSGGQGWFIASLDLNFAYLNVPITSDPWEATGGSGGMFSTPDFSMTAPTPVYSGGEDAYVVTWYDQSTNGNDAYEYTAGSQPKIASGGTLFDKVTFNSSSEELYTGNRNIPILYEADVNTAIQTSTSGVRVNINSDTKELIAYETDQTNNIFKIESNINFRYGLYTPTPTDAYLVTWYDQSGNYIDLEQPDKSKQPLISNAGRYLGYASFGRRNNVVSFLQPNSFLSGSISCCKVTEDMGVGTYDFIYFSNFTSNQNYVATSKFLELVYYDRDETTNNLAIRANMANHADAPVFGESDYFKRIMTDCIDNQILGADPATQKELYGVQNHSSSTYTRNEDFWLKDTFNVSANDTRLQALTCISPYNSDGSNKKAGVAITPRHIICATHYKIAVGSTIRFITRQNSVVDRTVVGTVSIGSSDIEIQILDSDLPSSITPCKVLPSNYASYLPADLALMPFLALDQEEKGLVGEIRTVFPDTKTVNWLSQPNNQALTAQRRAFGEEVVTFDSGNPMFFVTKTQLWLFSTAFHAFDGPLLSNYISEINTAINTLDTAQGISSGYTVTEGQWTENV